jgi:hypothetical protein
MSYVVIPVVDPGNFSGIQGYVVTLQFSRIASGEEKLIVPPKNIL